jgi:hypothetical protein
VGAGCIGLIDIHGKLAEGGNTLPSTAASCSAKPG